MDTDPIDVGEPYPSGLSEAVEARLHKYQAEYEELLRDKGAADFSKDAIAETLALVRASSLATKTK
jgi:hypothetical protein